MYLGVLLAVVVIASVCILLNTKITGKVADTGTLSAEISTMTAINFTNDTVNFGSISVPEGWPSCEIDTEGNTNCALQVLLSLDLL